MPVDDDALLDKLADDIVEAEYQRVNGTMVADAWKMICKGNIQLKGAPVYEPVAKLLMSHLKGTEFAAEVQWQGKRLLGDYEYRADDLFSKSGDATSAEGASKVADRSLLAPYNKPIFKIVCGEKCNYQDCALPPIFRKFLERLDCKLHARMLQTSSLSLKEMERIRSSLFKGILFTRVISPLLLEPDGPALDIPGTQKPVPHRVFQAWSGATNRSFNLDYKDFVRDFISRGNAQLPKDVMPLYQARQEQVRKNRTEALAKHSKRSKQTKARSMDTTVLPQGSDFRRAMEMERLAYKKELADERRKQSDDELEKTIGFYRERYAGNRTGAERKRFLQLFDRGVLAWKDSSPDVEDEGDIELALKKIHRDVRQELDEATAEKGLQSSVSSSGTKGGASISTTSELASPRGGRRGQYGVAEKAKQERAREQKFRDALKAFMNKPECADDLEDEEFKQDFENAAWNSFDSGQGLQDVPSLLRDLFEATILKHFIAGFTLPGAQSSQQSHHPQVRQLQSLVAVWQQHKRKDGAILTRQILSAIWMHVERDKVALANFKSALAGDKTAAAKFEALDAAANRWRAAPENFSKPLTDKALSGIWTQLDDQGSAEVSSKKEKREKPERDEPAPGPGQQRVKLEQARKKMEERLAEFIADPGNKDFKKNAFKQAFLDSAIALQKEKGISALQPEKLKRLYTSAQIALYWNQKAGAGWPDTARDTLSRLIHAKCELNRNHVADEEHFEEYRRLVMTQACRPMLEEFLNRRSSWKAMELISQGSFRQKMLQDLDYWINSGAHGNLQDLFKSFYQQKLIDAFRNTKQGGQDPTRISQLFGFAEQWIKDNPHSILESADLELMWNGTIDTAFLDEMLKRFQ